MSRLEVVFCLFGSRRSYRYCYTRAPPRCGRNFPSTAACTRDPEGGLRFVTTGLAGILAPLVGKEWTAKSIGVVCLLLAQILQRSHVSLWKLWTWINIWEVIALPLLWVASVTLQRPVPTVCQSAVSASGRCGDGASHRPTSVTCLLLSCFC